MAQLKPNSILYGDCFDIMPSIEEETIDLILTDPPYAATDADWDKIVPLDKMFIEFRRVLKPSGCMIITSIQPFTTDLINANRDMFKCDIIWRKNTHGGMFNAKKQPLREHENIIIFAKGDMTYNPQFTYGKQYVTNHKNNKPSELYKTTTADPNYYKENNKGTRYPTSTVYFPIESNRSHSTQKPVSLWKYLVKQFSNENELVLDPFCGSGTTAVACVKTKRRYICIEKDKKFYNISERRVKKITEEVDKINKYF